MSRSGLCAPGATGGILDSVYYKIWLGLDVEHGGLWWYEGVSQYMELPNAAERRQYCLEGIKQNLENPNAVAKLMWDKTSKAWFSPDTYYSFYFSGESYILASELQEADDPARVDELQNLQTDLYVMQDMFDKFDEVYLYVIWILVLVGLFALIWMPSVTILDLTTWIPLGWMCFISITEMQSRYRYQSMPALMLLAGLGAIYLHKKLSLKRLLPSAATEKERDGQNE